MARILRQFFRWVRGICPGASALAIIGLATGAPAAAQGLQVAPVVLELPAGQQVVTVTVSNQSAQAATMQVRGFSWTQPDGHDALVPTENLEVSPPIFEIPAGGSQLVRLLLHDTPQGAEAAYRLLFDQLPTAAGTGVTLALRFSIPLFAEPPTPVAADLDLHIERRGGTAVLVGRNHGTRHDRLFTPAIAAAGGRIGLAGNTNFYVLPGCEQRWALTGSLTALRPGSSVQLTATSVTGRMNTAVAVFGR